MRRYLLDDRLDFVKLNAMHRTNINSLDCLRWLQIVLFLIFFLTVLILPTQFVCHIVDIKSSFEIFFKAIFILILFTVSTSSTSTTLFVKWCSRIRRRVFATQQVFNISTIILFHTFFLKWFKQNGKSRAHIGYAINRLEKLRGWQRKHWKEYFERQKLLRSAKPANGAHRRYKNMRFSSSTQCVFYSFWTKCSNTSALSAFNEPFDG